MRTELMPDGKEKMTKELNKEEEEAVGTSDSERGGGGGGGVRGVVGGFSLALACWLHAIRNRF